MVLLKELKFQLDTDQKSNFVELHIILFENNYRNNYFQTKLFSASIFSISSKILDLSAKPFFLYKNK